MSLETINLQAEIEDIDTCIELAEKYIIYLQERYANPHTTIAKQRKSIAEWKKERYELEKELLVLTNQPCNS